MSLQEIATALERVKSVLQRRPSSGLHDDAPATARWQHGTRVESSHANGARVLTDMPRELGGGGDQVTPGWLLRASLASCTATSIALNAAAKGIELTELEVKAGSRSDARGLFGMSGEDGAPVFAGPSDVEMHVRIRAKGASLDELHALVRESQRCSPVPSAVETAVPVALHIDAGAG